LLAISRTHWKIIMDLSKHPLFEPWRDPESGIVSYLLADRLAPIQQSFYFVNSSVSRDGKWLWFVTGHPPGLPRSLAVASLDPANPVIRAFPQTAGANESPCVAPEGDAAYFTLRDAVYRVDVEGKVTLIAHLPSEFVANRRIFRITTHLTMSADGKYFLLDGEIGNAWYVATAEIATGTVKILHEFGRKHNHGQFSPVDPDLFLLAQDWINDPVTGRYLPFDQRIWLMNVSQTMFEPLCPNQWFRHGKRPCHEWWSADGKVCWVDYDEGAYECDLVDRKPVRVWPTPLCHAHCDPTRQYWCADESPYKWKDTPCQVRFFDRRRGKQVNIVTALPQPFVNRSWYHLDPHPQFTPDGSHVVYTTTVRGRIDVAIAPVQGILERM
jgi:hypothetical protein